jgi:hypothetical protein
MAAPPDARRYIGSDHDAPENASAPLIASAMQHG